MNGDDLYIPPGLTRGKPHLQEAADMLAELLKDKARLDWLETKNCGIDHEYKGEYAYYADAKGSAPPFDAPMRQACDDAMKEEGWQA